MKIVESNVVGKLLESIYTDAGMNAGDINIKLDGKLLEVKRGNTLLEKVEVEENKDNLLEVVNDIKRRHM